MVKCSPHIQLQILEPSKLRFHHPGLNACDSTLSLKIERRTFAWRSWTKIVQRNFEKNIQKPKCKLDIAVTFAEWFRKCCQDVSQSDLRSFFSAKLHLMCVHFHKVPTVPERQSQVQYCLTALDWENVTCAILEAPLVCGAYSWCFHDVVSFLSSESYER